MQNYSKLSKIFIDIKRIFQEIMSSKFPQNNNSLKQNENNSNNKEISQNDMSTRVVQDSSEINRLQRELKTFSKLVEHFDCYIEQQRPLN